MSDVADRILHFAVHHELCEGTIEGTVADDLEQAAAEFVLRCPGCQATVSVVITRAEVARYVEQRAREAGLTIDRA